MHLDFPRTGDTPEALDAPVAIVAFVALHDLQPEQGPTFFAPATHAAAFRSRVEAAWRPVGGDTAARQALMREQPLCRPLLRAGDVALMDSALWHAGGANTSGGRRTLLHFTFARRGALSHTGARASSLLDELRGEHALADAEQWTREGAREPRAGAPTLQSY